MISSRARDVADISRMLGMLPQDKLDSVLVVVRKYMSAQDARMSSRSPLLGDWKPDAPGANEASPLGDLPT